MSLKPRKAPGHKPAPKARSLARRVLTWRPCVAAVLDVLRANKKNEKLSGADALSVETVILSDFRKDLWQRVRAAWCSRTEQSWALFPLSEDFVCQLYLLVAKLSAAERNKLFHQLTPVEE